MPVSLSGVILGEARPPNGVFRISPPVKGAWPGPVWQGMQSAARVRYLPRAIKAALLPAGIWLAAGAVSALWLKATVAPTEPPSRSSSARAPHKPFEENDFGTAIDILSTL